MVETAAEQLARELNADAPTTVHYEVRRVADASPDVSPFYVHRHAPPGSKKQSKKEAALASAAQEQENNSGR